MSEEITILNSDAKTKLFLRQQPQNFHMTLPGVWILGVKLHFLDKLKLHTSVGLNKPLKSGQQF
jgi:hypothetical protein